MKRQSKISQALALLQAGLSGPVIAREHGLCSQTISQARKRLGIKGKPGHPGGGQAEVNRERIKAKRWRKQGKPTSWIRDKLGRNSTQAVDYLLREPER